MSVNKVILIGNVGKEPDIRYLDGGVAVATFPLATTERGYTLPNGTQVPDRTDWHNIVLWRGLAQLVEKYVHKGDKLYIEGKLRPRTYEDQNGQRKYVVEIYAENMEMLSSRPSGTNVSAAYDASSAASAVKQTVSEESHSSEDLPF